MGASRLEGKSFWGIPNKTLHASERRKASMNGDAAQVVFPGEAEAYVAALEAFDVKEIGNSRWAQQHERVEKLNQQAVISATQQEDEFVKEFLTTHDKIPTLIHNLIATESWKQKVFPEFAKQDLQPQVSFPVYIVLYHELTLVNLLETVLYHRDAIESGEDSMLDLADYCYRKLTALVAITQQQEDDDEEDDLSAAAAENISNLKELEKQNQQLHFDICIKTISILRYITDHLTEIPLSVTTRLLNTLDTPILLVQLVDNPPWTKQKDGKPLKYLDNKWQVVDESDRFTLSKTEGQVWLTLFQLLMSADCQKKYELNSYRKNILLKLRSHLTEVMLDQLPILGEMRRYLEQLSVMEPPPVKQDLVLEQVPEMREKMLSQNEGQWAKIAKMQYKKFFNPSKVDMKMQAERLANTYNFDVLDNLLSEPPKCALCGEAAAKRCSRCQNEWYCRRECQVNHWKKHKAACDLLVDANNKIKQLQQADIAKAKQTLP